MKFNEILVNRIFNILKLQANNGDKNAAYIVGMIETKGDKEVRSIHSDKINEVFSKMKITFE